MIQSLEDMIEIVAFSLKDFKLQHRNNIWLR